MLGRTPLAIAQATRAPAITESKRVSTISVAPIVG